MTKADFTDSFREESALAKYLAEQREKVETEFTRELALREAARK